jgi:uncharacterized protein with PIN domain
MTGRFLCMPYLRIGAEMLDKCPKCGNEVWHSKDTTNKIDKEFGQSRNHYWCPECEHEWDTLELHEAEVVRLRGLAHRAVMGGV